MHRLQQVGKLCLYLLLTLVLAWFALVSWVYLTPINWLTNQAQNGFIYQQLNRQGQEFIRQTSWRNLSGSLGKGEAQAVILPQARLENLNWNLSFISLLMAKPSFNLEVAATQLTSPLSLNLGEASASLKPESWQTLQQLAKQQQAKFDWQLSFFQPEEHQLNLSGSLTPKLYSFKGTAEISPNATLLPAMQLLNWRKTTTPAEHFTDGQSFQSRGSGRF